MSGNTEFGIRLRLDGAQQVQAGVQGSAQALDALDRKVAGFGKAAALTGHQTAQLSAQLQDLFIQIQSGGSPITALLQQGSQLSAVFGGTGNALRAVPSLITPTVASFGAAAAAIGAVGIAYAAAEAQRSAFVRGLVLSGNAIGQTVGSLNDAAAAVGKLVGGQSAASAAMAQYAATGQAAGVSMAAMAEAALRLERVGGAAVEETVKAFASLAKDPLAAALRLNDGVNFLTVSTYRQIKALQDQGNATEAARVAQEAFASESIARAKQVESQLGGMERGWLAVKDAITAAKEALLSIGRQDTPAAQVAKLQEQIDSLTSEMGDERISAERFKALDAVRQGLIDTQSALQSDIRLANQSATAHAARAAALKNTVKADEEAAKVAKQHADELARLIAQGKDLVQSQALDSAGYSASFLKDMQALQAYAKAAGLGADQLTKAIDALLAKQPFAVAAAKAEADAHKALTDALAREAAEREKHLDSLSRAADAQDRATQSLQDELFALQYGQAALYERVTLRKEEEAALLEIDAARALLERGDAREYQAIRERASALQREVDLRRQIAGEKVDQAADDAARKAAQKAADEWDRTADSIRDGLTDAFRRAFESGEDFGTAMAKVIERELKARIATALSGMLANGVMTFLGLQASGGGAGAGFGGAAGSSAMGLVQMVQAAKTLYGYGESLYGWATGVSAAPWAATAGPGLTAQTGTFGTLVGNSTGLGGGSGLGGTGSGLSVNSAGTWKGAFVNEAAVESTTLTAGNGAASSGSWGAAAGYAALIAASIIASDKAYDRGFTGSDQLSGKLWYESSLENATRSVLSKLGVNDKWAEILSGSVALNDSFGYSQARVEAAGVQGTLGAGDFTGQSFADIKSKAGWVRQLFGSDDRTSTEFSALPAELGNFLDTAAKSVFDQAKEFGEALGLPAEALAGITTDIKVTLTEDVEANKAEIAKALGTYGDALVGAWADAVKPLAQYGETTAQTIQRVGGALLGVNGVLDALGIAALDASTAGGQAAIALQELFGGQQGLEQAASGYLNAFYDDAERTNLTLAGIGKTLGEVGLQVPATREAFRGLVDAQDLTTESGRAAFASLMGVADAFAVVTPAAETAAEAAARMARETERIAAERTGLEERLLQLQGDTAELRRRELAALDPSNRALLEQIHALEDMSEAAAAAARETERVADALADMMDDLASAASDALATVRSTLDAERDRLQGTYNTAVEGIDAQIKAAQDAYAAEVARIDAARDAARADFEATVGPLQAKLKDLDALSKAQAAQYAAGRDALQDERQAAQDVYQAAAKALQDTIAAQQQVVQGLQSLTGSLTDTLRQLRPIGSEGLDRSRAQAQIAQALATARATGALPTAESLRDALSTVVRPSEALFGSFADYQRDFFRTAIDIRDLNDIAGDQLSGAQTALDVAIAQRDDLQAQHEANMERLDGLLTALEEANELARESIAAQRDSLQALIDAARGVFETRTERLDKDLVAAKGKLDATLEPLQQQKEQLAAQLEIDLSALEDLWKQAQAAYDAVVGNNTAALGSVATALGQLDSALAALATALKPGGKPAIPTGQWTASGGTEVWADPAGATALKPAGSSDPKSTIITTPDGRAFTVADARGVIDTAISTGTTATLATTAAAAGISAAGVDALAGFTAGTAAALADPTAKVAGFTAAEIRDTIRILLGEGNLRRIYDLATQYGISSYSVDALGGWARGTSLAWALGQGLPAFASGGDHWGGLRIVGERGAELEATGPSRIWSFDQLMRLLSGRGGDEVLAAEVRALRAEVAALRESNSAENQAIASSSADTARQLKRWDGDGMPEVRTA